MANRQASCSTAAGWMVCPRSCFFVPASRLVVVGLSSTRIHLPGRAAEQIINRMVPHVRVAVPLPSSTRRSIPAALTGQWRGELHAHNGPHRFRLSFEASGELPDKSTISLGVDQCRGLERRCLHGSILADLGTDDVRRPYRLRFELTRRSDRLEGPISAWSFRPSLAPDILPSFVSLHRDDSRSR